MKRPSLYTEFILWSAMPETEQKHLGLENQKQFAIYHKISEQTLSAWKQRPDFEDRVDAILKVWAVGKTPTVVRGIYVAAVKGNPMSQLLWLQYFKKFNPKNDTNEATKVGGAGVGDLKHLIDQLPEQMKQKHYEHLRELLGDIEAFRNARSTEEDHWDERPAQTIPDETDNDAQSLPIEERANEVAKSNKVSLRTDMGDDSNGTTCASENNNKSASRWW